MDGVMVVTDRFHHLMEISRLSSRERERVL